MKTKWKILWNLNLFFKTCMEFSLENLCLDIRTQSTNREGFNYILVH